MKKIGLFILPVVLITMLVSFTNYSSNEKEKIDCGCFLVQKKKGGKEVQRWNERNCDEYGYPGPKLRDRYIKMYQGTGFTVEVSPVADRWCEK